MEFDKIKVSLFISTLVLLVVTIGMIVFGIKQGEQIRQLKSDLKSVQTELADKQAEQSTDQSESEKIIKEFYKTVYNYEKSQQEISMTTVNKNYKTRSTLIIHIAHNKTRFKNRQ